MTDDEIAVCYTLDEAKEYARDIKMLIVSVMDQSGCCKDDAVRFVLATIGDQSDTSGNRSAK